MLSRLYKNFLLRFKKQNECYIDYITKMLIIFYLKKSFVI